MSQFYAREALRSPLYKMILGVLGDLMMTVSLLKVNQKKDCLTIAICIIYCRIVMT